MFIICNSVPKFKAIIFSDVYISLATSSVSYFFVLEFAIFNIFIYDVEVYSPVCCSSTVSILFFSSIDANVILLFPNSTMSLFAFSSILFIESL